MKLSKLKKEALVREVLKRKFDDKEEALNQLARSMVEALIKKELAGVPYKACEKYISFTTYAYYGFGEGQSYRHGKTFDVKLSERVPDKRNKNWYFSADNNKDLKKIAKAKQSIEEKRAEAKTALWAVMNSVNTEKQLLDTLPEMGVILNTLFDSRESTSLVAIETIEEVRGLLR